MKGYFKLKELLALTLLLALVQPALTCTNFLVTKGASRDQSVFITYAVDSHELYGELYFFPAGIHSPSETVRIIEWDTGRFLGEIPQAPETYRVVGNINEYQVSIGETTFGGRRELKNTEGIIDYGSLMYLALQRSKSARQAIQVMTDLVAEYGYCSSGESFSVADPNEAWILEMIGKGKGEKGAVWVARRIPDGYVCAHANQARIDTFPLKDPENCLYAADVIRLAREKGYFQGADENFSFREAYAPVDFGARRFCEARVWSFFRRVAPSLNLPVDYVRGDADAEPLPIWVKPDRKLGIHDLFALMRDHFEGTELDLHQGIGAGPYQLPYRWRPLTWKIGDRTYFNERATATQQTGWSFISQLRGALPDPIGGVHWFGVDDTGSTVYLPFYCGMTRTPRSYGVESGHFEEFSWNSAFWVFNFVANFAYGRYCDMIQDIRKVQNELEGRFVAEQAEIDRAARDLYRRSPRLAEDYLTDYCCRQADQVVHRWRKLGEFLIWKYLDGNVRDAQGKVTHPGYPREWYRRIVEENPEFYRLKEDQRP